VAKAMYDNNEAMIVKEIPIKEIDNNQKKDKVKKKKGFFLEWIVPVLMAVGIALLIKQFIIYKVEVPTGSMIPTINEKDQFLVTRIYNLDNIKRKDIIVFDSKEFNDVFIKRLIGLPGDDISIVDGKVSVNGEELDESYVVNHDKFNGEYHVPEGKYFFLGDNRSNSKDSRFWKNPYVDSKDIKAKEWIRVYPFKDFGTVK
jgi:signal peptidase I